MLYKDCEAARQIPRWKTPFIGSNHYEMSEKEYYQLTQLLRFIAEERRKIITDKIESLIKNAKNTQKAYSMLCDRESAWQNINDCLEQYKKITKEL